MTKSQTLPKHDLVTFLATDAGVTKAQAQAVLDALGPIVRTNAANGYAVPLPGLGRFVEKLRPARAGRNPATGEAVQIAESRALTFKASKAKEA